MPSALHGKSLTPETGQMSRIVEAQQAWIEAIVYQLSNLSKSEGDRLLGGITALAKANCGIVSDVVPVIRDGLLAGRSCLDCLQVMEQVCREAVQVLGGIGYTRGGQGDRIERAYREIKAIAIPGGSGG